MNKIRNIMIIYLVRNKFKLNKNQLFKFKNLEGYGKYCFTEDKLVEVNKNRNIIESNFSLNYLLSDKCKVLKLNQYL